jgi:hypothetical protein
MPFQHTPPRKEKIDKSGPSSAFGLGGSASESAGSAFPKSRSDPQESRAWNRSRSDAFIKYAPFAQNRENFTLRYLLGSFRNSFRSRRKSPAAPLMLS